MSPSNVVTLDGKLLSKIGHASATAEITMTDLALRERLRHFSDITRTKNRLIRDGEKIVEADYIAFWKSLQDAGVGVVVYGRRGKPDRFEWHYSMKKVATAAIEGVDQKVEKIKQDKPKAKGGNHVVRTLKKTSTPPQMKAVNDKFVYIPLRKDFCLEFKLPADISREELQTISDALRRATA